MSRMPGFTAEGALFERAQCYYGTAGVARSSGTVKPALGFATDPHSFWSFDLLLYRLCCLSCPSFTTCLPAPSWPAGRWHGDACYCSIGSAA
jgi:hypothetical protein